MGNLGTYRNVRGRRTFCAIFILFSWIPRLFCNKRKIAQNITIYLVHIVINNAIDTNSPLYDANNIINGETMVDGNYFVPGSLTPPKLSTSCASSPPPFSSNMPTIPYPSTSPRFISFSIICYIVSVIHLFGIQQHIYIYTRYIV